MEPRDPMVEAEVLTAEMADGALGAQDFRSKAGELRAAVEALKPKESVLVVLAGLCRSACPATTAQLLRLARPPLEGLLGSPACALEDFAEAALAAVRRALESPPVEDPGEPDDPLDDLLRAAAESLAFLTSSSSASRHQKKTSLRFLLRLLALEPRDGAERNHARAAILQQICRLSGDPVWLACEEAASSSICDEMCLGTGSLAEALLTGDFVPEQPLVSVRPHEALLDALTGPLAAVLREPGREPWLSRGVRLLATLLRLTGGEEWAVEELSEERRALGEGLLTAAATSPLPQTRLGAVRALASLLRHCRPPAAPLNLLRFLLQACEAERMGFLGTEKRLSVQALLIDAMRNDQRLHGWPGDLAQLSLPLLRLHDPQTDLLNGQETVMAFLKLLHILLAKSSAGDSSWASPALSAVDDITGRLAKAENALRRAKDPNTAVALLHLHTLQQQIALIATLRKP